MALTYDVVENKNAWREISKEEYFNEEDKRKIFQCPKFEEKGKYYEMNVETNMLIFLCGLIIGIPSITIENYEKVFNRIYLHEKINGATLSSYNPATKETEPMYYTLEMVKKNVGIKTNGALTSRKVYRDKIVNNLFQDRPI